MGQCASARTSRSRCPSSATIWTSCKSIAVLQRYVQVGSKFCFLFECTTPDSVQAQLVPIYGGLVQVELSTVSPAGCYTRASRVADELRARPARSGGRKTQK